MCPSINNLVVTLLVGNETHIVVIGDCLNLLITFLNEFFLFLRNDNIIEVERQTCEVCHTITEVLDTIEELTCTGETNLLDNVSNDVA